MISEIHIGNFKAFGPSQTIPLRPITLVFGPNSAGKSSIIQSLLLARHISEGGDPDAHHTDLGGKAVDLGGFNQYARKQVLVSAPTAPPTLQFAFTKNTILQEGSYLESHDSDFHDLATTEFMTAGIAYAIEKPSEQEVAITSIALFIDGLELLRFSRNERDNFLMPCEDLEDLSPALLNFMSSFIEIEPEYLLEACSSFAVSLADGLGLTVTDVYRGFHRYHGDFCGTRPPNLEGDEDEDRFGGAINYPEDPEDERATHKRKTWETHRLLDAVDAEDAAKNNSQTKKPSDSDKHDDQKKAAANIAAEDAAENISQTKKLHAQYTCQGFFQSLIRKLGSLVQSTLSNACYLGPLREIPPRYTVPGHRYDAAGGGDAWEYLKSNPEALGNVNRVLRDNLGLRYELDVRILTPELDDAAIDRAVQATCTQVQFGEMNAYELAVALRYELRLQASRKNVLTQIRLMDKELVDLELSLRDVGMGVSQLLPVVVQALASQNKLIAIEQPELHLHPALQADLADIFIEAALREKNSNMFLIETHSEHLILRIMRRIRESNAGRQPAGAPELKPEHVAILYVQPTDNGSVVKHLRLDERGRLIDEWPGGFFDESFNEIF